MTALAEGTDPAAQRLLAQLAGPSGRDCTPLYPAPDDGVDGPLGKLYAALAGQPYDENAVVARDGAAFYVLSAEQSLSAQLARCPSLYAALLDARARALTTRALDDGRTMVSISVDQRASPPSPLVLNGSPIDPASARDPISVVLARSDQGAISLQEWSLGRWATRFTFEESDANTFDTATGMVLMRLSQNAQFLPIPFGGRFRVTAESGSSAAFRTTPQSAARRARGLRFSRGVSPSVRRRILAVIRSLRRPARVMLDQVDGEVTVFVKGSTGELGRVSPANAGLRLDLAPSLFSRSSRRQLREVVAHELGHVVDFASDAPELKRRLDREIPRQSCRRRPRAPRSFCVPAQERFADTFARWALGRTRLVTGYNVRPPRSLRRWGDLLRRNWKAVPATTRPIDGMQE